MKNKKIISMILALGLTIAMILTGCGATTENTSTETKSTETTSAGISTSTVVASLAAEYDEEDCDTSYADNATKIVGTGGVVTIDGSGASTKDGNVTISKAGTYVLEGDFEGQILIEATSKDLVHLVLNGVTITCDNSAAIFGSQSDKIVITLVEGTTNTVTDAGTYVYADEAEDEPNAAIFSKDDLTINGTGTLIVNANYEDGIRTKDDLKIVSGTFQITSVKDAIQGKDSLCIKDGNFTINAGNDAFKSSNETDSDKGYVIIDGGTYVVSAADDAFHAETAMIINAGDIEILTSYEGIEGLTVEINGGNIQLYATDDGINAAGGSDEGESFFGGGMFGGSSNASITINGGVIYVNADGDGIDSNGNVYINGGVLYVNGPTDNGNAAFDYDGTATITGGTIAALGSSGMAQSFDSSSEQAFILYNFSQWLDAGKVELKDAAGNVLISYESVKTFNSILLSAQSLEENGTYYLTCGDETVEITLDGNSYSNGQSGFGGHGGFGGQGSMGGQGGKGGMGQRPTK